MTVLTQMTGTPLTFTDRELLSQHLNEGRHEAFADLVRRYQLSAYRTAFARIGNRAQAEEAVQEAFLALASTSGRKALGQADDLKLWFLGIVSNKARAIARNERNMTRREILARHRQGTHPMKMEAPSGSATRIDSHEVEAMETALGELREEHRMPLILYYMEDLSQRQVARIMGIHQSSVARRIEEALVQLRINLARSGTLVGGIALANLLKAPGLIEVPNKLQETLLHPSFLKDVASHSVRKTFFTANARCSVWAKTGLVVVALLLALGVYLSQPLRLNAASNQVSTLPAIRSWSCSFDQSTDEALVYIQGHFTINHVPTAGAKCLVAGSGTTESIFLLPDLRPCSPALVTVRCWPSENWRMGAGWLGESESNTMWKWRGKYAKTNPYQSIDCNFYIIDSYIVSCVGNSVGGLARYSKSADGFRLYLTSQNIAIERIEYRELRSEEVPKNFREIEKMIGSENSESIKITSTMVLAHPVPLFEYLKKQE